jgi:hypothetical protein
MMKRVIFEFLNARFKGVLVYHQRFSLSDKRTEKFITSRGNGIIEFSHFYSGKEIRTRVNSFLRSDIKNYFDIHEIDIEIYVLEWCYDKKHSTVEM